MNNTETWLRGIAAAAIGGLSSALIAWFAAPQAFDLSPAGKLALTKVIVGGSLLPVLAYLKQSPLPAASVTVTQESTVTATKN